MKILTVVGARPQFIKAGALSREFAKREGIVEVLVHTGQHFDANMSAIFFEEMDIPEPKYNLDIHSLNHGAMTGRMLEEIEKILLVEAPDLVLVYGDTNSTLAGALAAKKLHIKVAHVEAGLRSFNLDMPEEINRILTDRISDYLFCPTKSAVDNLMKEGFETIDNEVLMTGDVMQDAAIYYAGESENKSSEQDQVPDSTFVLCTLHRAENTDNPERLKAIIEALNEINLKTPVVVPIHPRTSAILEKLDLEIGFQRIDPVGYFDMIELLKKCSLVMTDSGGLQKEAYFFEKHCVTLRNETEWVELVEKGYNVLAGADKEIILKSFHEMLSKDSNFKTNLYGGGKASERIANHLLKAFG